MKDLNKISNELFSKIRGRFKDVTIGDEDATPTNDPMSARFFDFPFTANDKSLGQVSISVNENEITVIYSNELVTNEDELTKKSWYDFLKELRQFARKRLLNFDTRNINKSNLNKRDYKFLAQKSGDNNMNETKLYGTSRISYQKIGEARIMIKHTESVNQESATGRTQKIGKIYIESADGERFRYPFKHLSGARAMARHVSEGGNAYDDFGKHIVGLSEEMAKLRKFKNYMGRSAVMAESLAGYTDIVKERIATVKKTIESLQKPVYYKETFEAFESPVLEDVPSDVAENWIDELTIKQFNEELADVFPYIYKLIGEATKAESLGPEELEEKMTKLQASQYTCEDCGDTMHNPTTDCSHDCDDETGSWWKDKDGNGIPDVMEGPFKGVGKMAMKRKLNKQYKKSDLANFDKSGIDTDGKTPDEIGQMKSDYYHSNMDKADRAKKAKARLSREEMELEAAFEETMGQFSDTVCEDCGNPNWSNVSEEKKKGSHGKVCWKGYRRGKGNSCHKMGEDSNTMNPDAVQAWYSKYESKRSYDAYDLATGFFKYYLDSGIPTDAMEKGECAALIKKFGEDEFMDDPFGAMEKAPELAPISNALHAEFAKIVGKEAPDEEDVEQAANMVDNTDEGNAYAHAVKKAKMNGKKKGDKVDGPDGDEITLEKDQKTPLGEFILSYFDRDNGVFPKGETAVLTMVEKDYGEQFIDPAKAFIEQITAKFDEYQMRTQPQQMEAGGNCQSCSGTGSPIGTNSERCPDCNGTGSVEQKDEEFDRMRELAGLR